MRVNNRGEACFSSFEELAKSMNIKPVSKVTKDENKLKEQQEKFISRHKCKACGQPMTYIGGNIMTCTTPECKGIKITKENEDGTKSISYITSYDLLDEKGGEIAGNIFSAMI